jgi:hypothetical protein
MDADKIGVTLTGHCQLNPQAAMTVPIISCQIWNR